MLNQQLCSCLDLFFSCLFAFRCKKARRDWQDDQWREQRQEREEAAARYKKRLEERAKQKEELEKKKKEKEQGKEEEENKSGTLQNG